MNPAFIAEGKVGGIHPVYDVLQHHIETHKGDPFVVVELLTMIAKELKSFNPEEVTSDVGRQEVYRIRAAESLEIVETLFHDYFPHEYEIRFMETQ